MYYANLTKWHYLFLLSQALQLLILYGIDFLNSTVPKILMLLKCLKGGKTKKKKKKKKEQRKTKGGAEAAENGNNSVDPKNRASRNKTFDNQKINTLIRETNVDRF